MGGGGRDGAGGMAEEVADCRVTHRSPPGDISPDAQFPVPARAGGPDISADAVASSVRGRDGKRRASSPTLRSNFGPLGRFFGGGVGCTCPPGLETTLEAEGRADR